MYWFSTAPTPLNDFKQCQCFIIVLSRLNILSPDWQLYHWGWHVNITINNLKNTFHFLNNRFSQPCEIYSGCCTCAVLLCFRLPLSYSPLISRATISPLWDQMIWKILLVCVCVCVWPCAFCDTVSARSVALSTKTHSSQADTTAWEALLIMLMPQTENARGV